MAQRGAQLYGGNGDHGDDYFDTGIFDQLLEIKIRYGGAIDAIIIKYRVDGKILVRHFGGRGGEEEDKIIFKEGEVLTRIMGYYSPDGDSAVIRSLKFVVNGIQPYGPSGQEKGKPFELPAPGVNGTIVGFFGYAGTFLDSIGVHLRPK